MRLPVDDAEVSVVGEVAVVGSLPGDGGPRSTADFTPEGDALAVVARDIAQGNEELRRNWKEKQQQNQTVRNSLTTFLTVHSAAINYSAIFKIKSPQNCCFDSTDIKSLQWQISVRFLSIL